MCKYCDFVKTFENHEVIKEVCVRCGRHEIYRKYKVEGVWRISQKYRDDHVRDFCQPTGYTSRIFSELYGHTPLKVVEDARRRHQARKDRQEVLEDMRREIKHA